ncbi:hypothetical protein MRX96_048169 [Rhipicephalus microplus]
MARRPIVNLYESSSHRDGRGGKNCDEPPLAASANRAEGDVEPVEQPVADGCRLAHQTRPVMPGGDSVRHDR